MKSFAFAAIVASASALDATKFMQWILEHGKTYETEQEFQDRHLNWIQTDAAVEVLNDLNNGTTFAHNHFSDLSMEEYRRTMLGKRTIERDEDVEFTWLPEVNEENGSVDWRSKGAVTPVKDQGYCGSCWSFSSSGAMEGAHKIKSGKLLSLSEQQFVDCSTKNWGCDGGDQSVAFKYAKNSAIELESDYPYRGKDGSCKYSSTKGKVLVKSITTVPNNDVSQLKSAVAKQPVAVSIDASCRAFNNYSSGIFWNSCGNNIDHAVLAVGYGGSGDNQYWIVKNSWATSWGEKGYIRIGIQDGKGINGIQSDYNCYPTTN